MSRAAVRLASGEVGFGYTLGRDGEKARLIALCDALAQSRDFCGLVEREGDRAVAQLAYDSGEPSRKAAGDGRDAGRFLHHGAR